MTTSTTDPRLELEQHLHMYRQMAKIRAFEEHVARQGTAIMKFYLHLGKAAQKERFLERIAHSFQTVHWTRERGAEVVRLAENWLRQERRGERFFLWLHLFDPHRWKNLENAAEPLLPAEASEDFAAYVMELHGLERAGVEGLLAQRWDTKDGKSVQLTASELALFIEGCELVGRRSLSPLSVKPKVLALDPSV